MSAWTRKEVVVRLQCARDDCHGYCDLRDVNVVAFDPQGSWECRVCGQKCRLPDDYIDVDDPATWWLIEDER